MLVPGGTIASMRSRSSSDNTRSPAPSWDSSCSIVRGPMIAALTAARLADPVRLDDRRRRERRAADRAHLAGVHEVAERAERLVEVRPGIEAVHLVEVDPVGLQAPQRALDLAHDPPARVAAHVG